MAEGEGKSENKGKKKLPDFVQPMNFPINPADYTNEQIERVVKAGFQIVAEDGKARVIGRTVIKGDNKADPLDVSK